MCRFFQSIFQTQQQRSGWTGFCIHESLVIITFKRKKKKKTRRNKTQNYVYSMIWIISVNAKCKNSFPGRTAGKEFACNAGEPGLIPELGRSPGEGLGYPLQYSWTSLVAQMIKNLPVMQETWTDSWIWKIPWRRAWQPAPVFLPG